MSDHMAMPLDELRNQITADGVIDATEVAIVKKRIYADGSIDRDEADFLFALNNAVTGAQNHPSWKDLFVQALTDHFLKDENSPGEVDEEEGKYLIDRIASDGNVDEPELALLINIISSAKKTPAMLQQFVLSTMEKAILEDSVIDANEVANIRTVVYGLGSGSGAGISRDEADFLFRLNDATSGKNNDSSWQILFVEAISKYVLEDEQSPGIVDNEEAEWLLSRIDKDGTIDENEKELLVQIKRNAKHIADKLEIRISELLK